MSFKICFLLCFHIACIVLTVLSPVASAHTGRRENLLQQRPLNRTAKLTIKFSETFMHLICWDQSDLMAVQKKWVLSRHSDIMFWCCTDAQRIRCAVRKRYKQLHSYLSSLCQSPSNRSRNRYRGGSGSTSFSSSTMVPLLKTQRQRQIPPQTAPPQRGGDLLQNQLSSSSFCYSEHKSVTNTLIHLMVPYSSFFRKKRKKHLSSLPPVTMQLYFSSHWGNRSKTFIRRWVGVAPLFCDSWRATGCLSLTPASSLPELHMDALTANV